MLFGQVYRYPRHTVHPAIAVLAGIAEHLAEQDIISPGTRFSCRARSIPDTAIGVIVALLVNYFLPRERVVRLWEGFKKRLGLCR